MAVKSVRLSVGSIFPKGPGKIWFYRYQVDGHRKTVSLQTTNRTDALRKAEEFIPIIKATSPEVIAAHVHRGQHYILRLLLTPERFRRYGCGLLRDRAGA